MKVMKTCNVQFDGDWSTALVSLQQLQALPVVPPSMLPSEVRVGEQVQAQDPFSEDKSWYEAFIEDVRQGGIIEQGKITVVDEEVPTPMCMLLVIFFSQTSPNHSSDNSINLLGSRP